MQREYSRYGRQLRPVEPRHSLVLFMPAEHFSNTRSGRQVEEVWEELRSKLRAEHGTSHRREGNPGQRSGVIHATTLATGDHQVPPKQEERSLQIIPPSRSRTEAVESRRQQPNVAGRIRYRLISKARLTVNRYSFPGFSVAEARIGLRATQGDVNAAAEYINSNREKRKESRKKTLQEWVKNKEKYKLGKCADGKQYVEPRFVEMMMSMGYSKETARKALQQSNNNVSLSVQIIQDNPDLLNVSDTGSNHSLSHVIEDMVPQVRVGSYGELFFNIHVFSWNRRGLISKRSNRFWESTVETFSKPSIICWILVGRVRVRVRMEVSTVKK